VQLPNGPRLTIPAQAVEGFASDYECDTLRALYELALYQKTGAIPARPLP
jgi:hypothetical protein